MSAKMFNFSYRSKYHNILNVLTRYQSVWTYEKVVKSPFKDVEIPKVTSDEYTWRNLDKWATKTAVVCGITNRSYTYEQVYKNSRVLAANLRKKFKIKDGDTVAVILPNLPEYPEVIFGILAAGGIPATFNPIYTAYETQRLLQLSETTVIVTIEDVVATIKEALALAKKNLPIISITLNQNLPEGTVSYKEMVDDVHTDLSILKEVKRKHEDVGCLLFSSGTTGLPKGVQLTNRNIIANSAQQDTECRPYEYTTETHQDNILAVVPMFHSYGLSTLMIHKLSVGVKIVTLPKFQPETFLSALLNNRIHLIYVAPPMVMFMGSYPQVTAKHLDHLRFVMSGGAPLPTADIERFLDKANNDIHFCQSYGMTEASPLIALTPVGHKTYENVGYAIPNMEMRIVDADMRNLGPGDVGELFVRGPNVMKGYLKNPQANSEAFVDGDWLRSGDLGKINENGLLTITGRLKELIKVKGYQVPPAELESVLKEHPSVFDVAVIGVPDSAAGEKPIAFIVLREDNKVTAENIISFVSERVAPYKKIKDVIFLDTIPKNPSGKILRKVLRENYC